MRVSDRSDHQGPDTEAFVADPLNPDSLVLVLGVGSLSLREFTSRYLREPERRHTIRREIRERRRVESVGRRHRSGARRRMESLTSEERAALMAGTPYTLDAA